MVIGPQDRVRTSGTPSGTPKTLAKSMYDVVYIDAQGSETPLAQHLDDRKDAAAVARQAAAERGVGRMVLPGSSKLPNCVCVIPVPQREAA
jgi:hypothetical protein